MSNKPQAFGNRVAPGSMRSLRNTAYFDKTCESDPKQKVVQAPARQAYSHCASVGGRVILIVHEIAEVVDRRFPVAEKKCLCERHTKATGILRFAAVGFV